MSEVINETVLEVVPARDVSPASLIALAIDKGSDIDKLERLFDLEQRYNADKAKMAYAAAMAALQSELDPVKRDKENGQTSSMYASLEAVIKQLQPLKAKHGFSVSFNTEDGPESSISGVASLMHIGGHSETFRLRLPLDAVGIKGNRNKTEIHATSSAVSYLRRYLEAMIFNVVFTDEDDDGQDAGIHEIEAVIRERDELIYLNEVARKNIANLIPIYSFLETDEGIGAAAEGFASLSNPDLQTLNRAPSKGGPFDTAGRAYLKNDEDFKALVHECRTKSGWYNEKENQN